MPDSTAITAELQIAWPSEPLATDWAEIGLNTSGMRGRVPAEIAALKWHWGAAGLAPFWLFRHNYKALALALVTFTCIAPFVSEAGPWLIGLVCAAHMGASVCLGLIGHRLAWRGRRFDSIEHFQKVQRVWSICSIGLTLLSSAFLLFLAAVYSIVIHAMNVP